MVVDIVEGLKVVDRVVEIVDGVVEIVDRFGFLVETEVLADTGHSTITA